MARLAATKDARSVRGRHVWHSMRGRCSRDNEGGAKGPHATIKEVVVTSREGGWHDLTRLKGGWWPWRRWWCCSALEVGAKVDGDGWWRSEVGEEELGKVGLTDSPLRITNSYEGFLHIRRYRLQIHIKVSYELSILHTDL